jgi:hypothetical protein
MKMSNSTGNVNIQSGTDVMISKIFSPKSSKNGDKINQNIVVLRKTPMIFFAENCDHNIGPPISANNVYENETLRCNVKIRNVEKILKRSKLRCKS